MALASECLFYSTLQKNKISCQYSHAEPMVEPEIHPLALCVLDDIVSTVKPLMKLQS